MSSGEFVLTVRTGPYEGRVFKLDKESVVLGRDVSNDIIFPDPEVSRMHSRLSLTPRGYVLEDLDSTNGTFVNGEQLTEPRLLLVGDQIGLSQKLIIAFEEASEASDAMLGVEPEVVDEFAAAVEPSGVEAAAVGEEFEVVTPAEPKEEQRDRKWWLIGIGAAILIVVCGVLFWFLDANYHEILYAPLDVLMRLLDLQ
ncbi:MAG TPA: FHA domain-containing protein [Anaerolineae bacterium]|nr:FHA domain-containing protein [Anaerolineae bacterium]